MERRGPPFAKDALQDDAGHGGRDGQGDDQEVAAGEAVEGVFKSV